MKTVFATFQREHKCSVERLKTQTPTKTHKKHTH